MTSLPISSNKPQPSGNGANILPANIVSDTLTMDARPAELFAILLTRQIGETDLSALTADHQKLQNKEAACGKDLAESERHRAETQKQLEEKQLAFERAQADIVRIEKVLSDRNQEAGRTMTQMRQELDDQRAASEAARPPQARCSPAVNMRSMK